MQPQNFSRNFSRVFTKNSLEILPEISPRTSPQKTFCGLPQKFLNGLFFGKYCTDLSRNSDYLRNSEFFGFFESSRKFYRCPLGNSFMKSAKDCIRNLSKDYSRCFSKDRFRKSSTYFYRSYYWDSNNVDGGESTVLSNNSFWFNKTA